MLQMNFDDIINELNNNALKEDCKEIIKEIENFKVRKYINFNAFDKIFPIAPTSQQIAYQFTELKNGSVFMFLLLIVNTQ